MKIVKSLLTATIAAVALAACNHEVIHPVVNEHVGTAVQGEAVDVTIDWVKNKKDSVDVLVWLTNRTQQPVFSTHDSYKLNFDGVDFTPRADEGLVQIPSGQKQKVVLVFHMPENKERAGHATLKIDPLFQGLVGGDKKTKLSPTIVKLDLTGKATH